MFQNRWVFDAWTIFSSTANSFSCVSSSCFMAIIISKATLTAQDVLMFKLFTWNLSSGTIFSSNFKFS